MNIEQHLDWLNDDIRKLTKAIQDHIDQHPDLKQKRDLSHNSRHRLATLAILLAFYADTDRFANSHQDSAFAGLDPRQFEFSQQCQRQATLIHGRPLFPAQGAIHARQAVTRYKTAPDYKDPSADTKNAVIPAGMTGLLYLAEASL